MFCCPVCKKELILLSRTFRCENNHCFDLARKGYVNLLMSQSSGKKIHGDDKTMALSRRDFLNSGHYSRLADHICMLIKDSRTVLDVGCGEGYYTCAVKKSLGDSSVVAGIDISKNIIETACQRAGEQHVMLAVAGCTKIPVADNVCDAVLSVFAPVSDPEFYRILKNEGKVVRVTAGTEHLIELKKAVYENAIANPEIPLDMSNFDIDSQHSLKYKFKADNNQVKNLFTMTPYYYKTSKSDMDKLNKIKEIEITADFLITVYKKKDIN